MVDEHFYAGMAIHRVLLHGANGRYLDAPDAMPRDFRLCLFSSPYRAAKQRDYDSSEVPANLWRPVATSREDAYLLQDGTERYLRAKLRCLLQCCSGLHVSGCRYTAAKLAMERVPRKDRPQLPRPAASKTKTPTSESQPAKTKISHQKMALVHQRRFSPLDNSSRHLKAMMISTSWREPSHPTLVTNDYSVLLYKF